MKYSIEKLIFNEEYEMVKQIEANEKFKIYLCRSLKDQNKFANIKVFRKSFIYGNPD